MLAEIDAYIEAQDVQGQLERFAETFLPPAGDCFVGRLDDLPLGCVMLKSKGDGTSEMNRMYVAPEARGHGLGRKLGEALIAAARDRGDRTLFLDALYRHVEALPLYESLGFERYTDPDAVGGDDGRFIHMKLDLT
nr:GNAT family N-acetyltransferase [Thetidibacter halocola]